MNREWVNHWLEILSLHIKSSRRSKWTVFEPTPYFYTRLESGDDDDLEVVANEIGRHLEILILPYLAYEWGLKIKQEAAGQIKVRSGLRSHVQIPLFYVGKPHALGGILAHELTHEFLISQEIGSIDTNENEQLTDLASIALGLGKLVLNGTVSILFPSTGEKQILGYLAPELKAFAYRKVNEQHRISDAVAKENLTDVALLIVTSFT